MNNCSIFRWRVVNRDPEFGEKLWIVQLVKISNHTSRGDKNSTPDGIFISSEMVMNWLAPWRVHLFDELLVLIVTIPGRRRRVPICECSCNMKNTCSKFQSNRKWREGIQ
jgi:hypothetical protein